MVGLEVVARDPWQVGSGGGIQSIRLLVTRTIGI